MSRLYHRGGSSTTYVYRYEETESWTAPAGVTSVTVQCWGGGQAGTAGTNLAGSVGGHGGAYAEGTAAVTPGNSYTVNVGIGGQTSAAAGGDSYFNTTGTVCAKGGNSATTSVGTTTFAGGTRGAGQTAGGGGGGGGGAGSAGAGGNGASAPTSTGGTAGAGDGGAGGAGGASGNTGVAGSKRGGGGGGGGTGAGNPAGGRGAGGRVILTWTVAA